MLFCKIELMVKIFNSRIKSLPRCTSAVTTSKFALLTSVFSTGKLGKEIV